MAESTYVYGQDNREGQANDEGAPKIPISVVESVTQLLDVRKTTHLNS